MCSYPLQKLNWKFTVVNNETKEEANFSLCRDVSVFTVKKENIIFTRFTANLLQQLNCPVNLSVSTYFQIQNQMQKPPFI